MHARQWLPLVVSLSGCFAVVSNITETTPSPGASTTVPAQSGSGAPTAAPTSLASSANPTSNASQTAKPATPKPTPTPVPTPTPTPTPTPVPIWEVTLNEGAHKKVYMLHDEMIGIQIGGASTDRPTALTINRHWADNGSGVSELWIQFRYGNMWNQPAFFAHLPNKQGASAFEYRREILNGVWGDDRRTSMCNGSLNDTSPCDIWQMASGSQRRNEGTVYVDAPNEVEFVVYFIKKGKVEYKVVDAQKLSPRYITSKKFGDYVPFDLPNSPFATWMGDALYAIVLDTQDMQFKIAIWKESDRAWYIAPIRGVSYTCCEPWLIEGDPGNGLIYLLGQSGNLSGYRDWLRTGPLYKVDQAVIDDAAVLVP